MNRALRVFNILLHRKAAIVHPTPVEEISGAVRVDGPGHGGNCVDNKAKVIFALAQCTFSLLAFRDFSPLNFISPGKFSGSLDDALFQVLAQPFYLLLGLH
jgi:hypothetical protein